MITHIRAHRVVSQLSTTPSPPLLLLLGNNASAAPCSVELGACWALQAALTGNPSEGYERSHQCVNIKKKKNFMSEKIFLNGAHV